MNENKRELRNEMIQKRNLLSEKDVQQLSDEITAYVIQSDLFKSCSHICIYQAFRNEVSCDAICKAAFLAGKHVYVPVTDLAGRTIEFFEIFKDTLWEKGAYGIMEPVLSKENHKLEHAALVCMPGLIFDKDKHRIGYGGGYYDKYLQEHPRHKKIALCYGFQILEKLPYEEHDISPDYVVSENGMI